MSIDRPNVIVIGAGPVGMFAAAEIGAAGYRPVLVEALAQTGGQCAALYPERAIHDAPGHDAVDGAGFIAALARGLSDHAALILNGRRARSVWGDLDAGFSVETDTGETITGAAVIFAGGAGALAPRPFAAEGVEAIGAGDISYNPASAGAAAGRRVAVLGDGAAAIDLALDAATRAASVSLIHAGPLRAGAGLIDRLREAAAARRLHVVKGDVDRVFAPGGRLNRISVDTGEARETHDVDLLLVQAGLEFARNHVTGLGQVADPMTGETETPGVFIIGDALPARSRPPLIAAGFSEAGRAVRAVHQRLAGATPLAPARAA